MKLEKTSAKDTRGSTQRCDGTPDSEGGLPACVGEVSRQTLSRFSHSKRVGNYFLGKTLGEGSFAKVKEGLHLLTGEKVAVKCIDKKKAKEDVYVRKNMRREGKLLQLVRHRHVIKLYEIMETENSYYLVTELCRGGDLMDYICTRKKLDEDETKRFIKQIISAVHYLHRAGILHRDLKVENLLLDESKDIKIIDFGLSNAVRVSQSPVSNGTEQFCVTQCGSPAYAAPELLGNKKYGHKVDIWSIGVNMFAMLTGNLPFTVEPFNIKALHQKMLDSNMNPLPDTLSKEGRDFIKKLLTPDPDSRMALTEAMRHPWITRPGDKPMEPAPFPNKLSADELNNNIINHMTENLDFRLSDVIRLVTANTPSGATATYHLFQQKLNRYNAEMRVRGAAAEKGAGLSSSSVSTQLLQRRKTVARLLDRETNKDKILCDENDAESGPKKDEENGTGQGSCREAKNLADRPATTLTKITHPAVITRRNTMTANRAPSAWSSKKENLAEGSVGAGTQGTARTQDAGKTPGTQVGLGTGHSQRTPATSITLVTAATQQRPIRVLPGTRRTPPGTGNRQRTARGCSGGETARYRYSGRPSNLPVIAEKSGAAGKRQPISAAARPEPAADDGLASRTPPGEKPQCWAQSDQDGVFTVTRKHLTATRNGVTDPARLLSRRAAMGTDQQQQQHKQQQQHQSQQDRQQEQSTTQQRQVQGRNGRYGASSTNSPFLLSLDGAVLRGTPTRGPEESTKNGDRYHVVGATTRPTQLDVAKSATRHSPDAGPRGKTRSSDPARYRATPVGRYVSTIGNRMVAPSTRIYPAPSRVRKLASSDEPTVETPSERTGAPSTGGHLLRPGDRRMLSSEDGSNELALPVISPPLFTPNST